MITIEGIGGNGSLWGNMKLPNSSAALPSTVTSYCKQVRVCTPIAPFEVMIPPTGGSGIYYDCALTPYGPRVVEMKIGSIIGVNKSPTTPNPCKHTTMKGSLLYTGPNHAFTPRWCSNHVTPLAGYTWYNPSSGAKLAFSCGRPSASTPHSAYNRTGVKQSFSTNTDNKDLWYGDFANLTDWCDSADSSTPTYVNGALQKEWMVNRSSWNDGFLDPTYFQRYSATHVSENVWIEKWDQEYHHNASYVPRTPCGHDQLGFVVASTSRLLEHRITHIQAVTDVLFRVLVTTKEYVSYWGHKPHFPVAEFFSGSVEATYKSRATIGIMEPGLSLFAAFDPTRCDAYCDVAMKRAKELYEGKAMKTARSRAISDVSGLESNWIENLSQVRGTASVITPLITGYRAVKRGNLRQAKDSLAGAYLSYKYTVEPAVRDYNDVKDNIGNVVKSFTKYRFSNERRRGMEVTSCPVLETLASRSYFCTLHLQLKDNSFSAVWNALDKLGLDPSLANGWDLIPFSFVVDWFLEIGSALDIISAYLGSTVTQNVKSRIQTFAVKWPLSKNDLLNFGLDDFSIASTLDYSWYDRQVLTGSGTFDPFAGQLNDGLSASQMAQGAALLTSFI